MLSNQTGLLTKGKHFQLELTESHEGGESGRFPDLHPGNPRNDQAAPDFSEEVSMPESPARLALTA
jgi:hypothetical protein